jgi:hypothetical protein
MRKRFSIFSVALLMALSFTVGAWLPQGQAVRRRPPTVNAGPSTTVAGGLWTIHKAGLFGVKCDNNLTMKVHSDYGHTINIEVKNK